MTTAAPPAPAAAAAAGDLTAALVAREQAELAERSWRRPRHMRRGRAAGLRQLPPDHPAQVLGRDRAPGRRAARARGLAPGRSTWAARLAQAAAAGQLLRGVPAWALGEQARERDRQARAAWAREGAPRLGRLFAAAVTSAAAALALAVRLLLSLLLAQHTCPAAPTSAGTSPRGLAPPEASPRLLAAILTVAPAGPPARWSRRLPDFT